MIFISTDFITPIHASQSAQSGNSIALLLLLLLLNPLKESHKQCSCRHFAFFFLYIVLCFSVFDIIYILTKESHWKVKRFHDIVHLRSRYTYMNALCITDIKTTASMTTAAAAAAKNSTQSNVTKYFEVEKCIKKAFGDLFNAYYKADNRIVSSIFRRFACRSSIQFQFQFHFNCTCVCAVSHGTTSSVQSNLFSLQFI